MKVDAAKTKLTLKGKIEYYMMDNGLRFIFRETPAKEGDWAQSLNLPFEIYNKFKDNEVEIIVTKI